MKTYTFQPRGVCSREMRVDLDDQGVIQDLQVMGGCCGLGQGAQEAVRRLKGIRCGAKSTSCPDQLALGLEQLLAQG